eukprot:4762465-Pleurochrysis_carterae.AAC.1
MRKGRKVSEAERDVRASEGKVDGQKRERKEGSGGKESWTARQLEKQKRWVHVNEEVVGG